MGTKIASTVHPCVPALRRPAKDGPAGGGVGDGGVADARRPLHLSLFRYRGGGDAGDVAWWTDNRA